jgi:RHS repeat-associated protein
MVSNGASQTTYGQYDALGRVLESTQTTGGVSYPFTYTYNRTGAMTGMTFQSGRTEAWAYDTANRLSGVSGAPSGGSSKSYASSILYWPQGEISQMTLGNNLVEVRSFSSDRLQPNKVTLGTSASDSSLLSVGVFYCQNSGLSCTNNNGNVQSEVIGPLNVTQIYCYDTVNRLVSAQEGSTWSETYGYDLFGNRWANSPQGLPSALTPTAVSAYDETTNRLGTSSGLFEYDNNGNLTKMSPETLAYDAENRQTKVSSVSDTATYTYDGDGRRVTKTAGGNTTTYVYDAAGELAAEYVTVAQSADCTTCYLTTDPLGSTRVITDGNGNVVSRHDYYPFGEELATSNRTSALQYGVTDYVAQRFTGKERDTETGLDFFGARYMSSAQGRFTSVDPAFESEILELPQTWNRYSYVYNNPLRYRDPDGRCPNCFAAGVGAVIGGAIEGGIDLYSQLRQNGGDWSQINGAELGGSIAGGAVAGGLAGFTLGGSLVADIAVGGAANVAGGIVNRTIQSAAGDGTVDPLGGDDVAADFVAGAAGGAIGHGVGTLAADATHSPIVGPKPRPGRNFRARQAAYNARKGAVQNAAVRGFAVGTAASTPPTHWLGSVISNGFWNSLDWLVSSPPPQPPPVKACVTVSDSATGTTSTQCQ